MKVLFLDFDGVLNSLRFFEAPSKRAARRAKGRANKDRPVDAIDPDAVALLNQIVERSGAKVVISSSWRVPYRIGQLRAFLRERGCVASVIGVTPILGSCSRGDEIALWLAAHSVEAFAILDDMPDMAHLKPHLVQTDTATGLQPEHVEAALALLANCQRREL